MSQLTPTVDPRTFTFADWQAIALQLGNETKWGYYKWLECYGQIQAVSLEEWEAIASELGYSDTWGYKQYKIVQSQAA